MYTLLCYHKFVFPCTSYSESGASCQHTFDTHTFVSHYTNDHLTLVCAQWRLLRFCKDRYVRRLRCALVVLSEVHINNNSMLRYDYKEFSAALGKRVKQLRKERKLTLRALVIQHG